MSLKTRRILFILFIIAFLIITPLVMSYAVGYKLSLSGKIIQKTGMLILDTEPEGAKIYLNGKPRRLFFKKYFKKQGSYITTPAKIKNLMPGEYDVKLKLDGYSEWKKKLEIKPGMSTYAEDIYLFKKKFPFLLSGGGIKQISLSPNGKYLASVSDKEINLIDLDNEGLKKLSFGYPKLSFKLPELNSFLWSPDSKKILINHTIYNIDNLSEKLNLNNFIESGIIKLKWYGNNKIIYLSFDKNIKIFGLTDKISETLEESEKNIDFLAKNNHLFLINQVKKTANLIINEIGSKKTVRNIELPSSSSYKFINPQHRLINLYDAKHQILYLIDPFSRFPLGEIINNVKNSYWVDENKLLYANDFEIWLFDFRYRQKTLLTRISEQINDIMWHPSNNYVIYAVKNSIYAIELDDREKHNITELINLDNISFPRLNKDGKKIYFYAQIGNQEGLYKLDIQ